MFQMKCIKCFVFFFSLRSLVVFKPYLIRNGDKTCPACWASTCKTHNSTKDGAVLYKMCSLWWRFNSLWASGPSYSMSSPSQSAGWLSPYRLRRRSSLLTSAALDTFVSRLCIQSTCPALDPDWAWSRQLSYKHCSWVTCRQTLSTCNI